MTRSGTTETHCMSDLTDKRHTTGPRAGLADRDDPERLQRIWSPLIFEIVIQSDSTPGTRVGARRSQPHTTVLGTVFDAALSLRAA